LAGTEKLINQVNTDKLCVAHSFLTSNSYQT